MAGKTKQYENKIKNWIKVERMECQESWKKTERGEVDAPPRKRKIYDDYNNDYKVQNTKTICVSIGTRPKEHPSETLKRTKPCSR